METISTLRSDAHTHFLDLFSNRISFVSSTFLAVYYMWILIRDHGRLRVPRQAKFLSRKYLVYWS